jgi:GNAT superfamily N-acetyltransferase
VIIRAATDADVIAIVELARQLGYVIAPDELRCRLLALPAEREVVFVAQDDEAVVGWIQMGVAMAIESAPHAEIRGLVVSELRRGKGIGRQLIAAGTDWAKGHGLTVVRVRSNITRSQTHQFYRHLGFADKKQQLVFEKTEES